MPPWSRRGIHRYARRMACCSESGRRRGTVSEIAAYLGITKQSAAVMVDELVASGYVSKHPHRSDRRSQLVRLTSAVSM